MSTEDKDPYDLGWEAGFSDDIPENPFPEGSPEHKEWNDGYDQGSMDC
jgi:hypothetical protein